MYVQNLELHRQVTSMTPKKSVRVSNIVRDDIIRIRAMHEIRVQQLAEFLSTKMDPTRAVHILKESQMNSFMKHFVILITCSTLVRAPINSYNNDNHLFNFLKIVNRILQKIFLKEILKSSLSWELILNMVGELLEKLLDCTPKLCYLDKSLVLDSGLLFQKVE